MRDYGKVHSTFWSSPTTGSMSDDGKVLSLYLLTCSHSTIAGVFRLPDGYVSEDLGWPLERVAQGFSELFAKGFANRCVTTKWVWICKHLEWNKPENPNQRKSAAKIAFSVPNECCWKLDFMRVCGLSLGLELPPNSNPSSTVEKPFLNQEQKQKQEQKQEQEQENKEPDGSVGGADPDEESPDCQACQNEQPSLLEEPGGKPPAKLAKPKLPACPKQAMVDLYHEVLPELPRVRVMDKDREKALAEIWQWSLTTPKSDGSPRASNAEEALAWLRSYFVRARDNDFLMGRGYRSPEHQNWRCTIEYLVSARGRKKVIEETVPPEALNAPSVA